MSPLTEPTKLTLRKSWQPMDADAAAYITAVETADGQALEEKVKIAIDNFVLGCKADGIWNAIKASCILAGARKKEGAFIDLKTGTQILTNNGFADGDYNRKTGLKGNGSNKYLNSNRSYTADPQNSFHLSVSISTAASGDTQMYIGGQGASTDCVNDIYRSSGLRIRNRGDATASFGAGTVTGFVGSSRASSTGFTARASATSTSTVLNSVALSTSQAIYVFARNNNGTLNLPTDARLAFYSIGESLDLALLDARVTDLITAFGAAIP